MRMQNRIRRQNGYVEHWKKAYILLGRNRGSVHGFLGGVLEYRVNYLFHQDLYIRKKEE